MSMSRCVLDTDTLSHLLNRKPVVARLAQRYIRHHGRLTISLITRYELLKGLRHRNAVRQITDFDTFCASHDVLPLTDEIVSRAAHVYAELRSRGETIGDLDILIAATAFANGMAVATNNVRHFQRISGLPVENWATTSRS